MAQDGTTSVPNAMETSDESTLIPAIMTETTFDDAAATTETMIDDSLAMISGVLAAMSSAVRATDTTQPSVTTTVPFISQVTMTVAASDVVFSTFYDPDSTTTITTTPGVSLITYTFIKSTVPGVQGTASSAPTLVTSAEVSSHITLNSASKAGISVAIAVSVITFVVGPLIWLWRKRWRYRSSCCGRRKEQRREPRKDALSPAGARRDALNDSETQVRVYEKDLGEHKMSMGPEDEIEYARWECKGPPLDLREGISELDGDVCAPYWQRVVDQPRDIRELDGTETSARVDERAVQETSNVQLKSSANGEKRCALGNTGSIS